MAYLLDGARFKIMGSDDEGYCKILGLPKRLNGEWVALVNATDDRHLLYTTPPSVEAAIEATKEKAIRIAVTFGDTGRLMAAAIKGMK